MSLARMMEIATRSPIAKRKTDPTVTRINQSPRTMAEEIPVRSRNAKLNPPVLVKPQW